MKFPTIEEMAKDVAEKAFDEYEHQGKTIRQWVEVLKDYDDKQTTLQRIVEQLEALKMRYFLTIANTGNGKLDFAYEKAGNAIDKAIEIVRGEGGL